MRLELENRYKILFIIFVVLAVYYPAISGGINSLDDSRIIDVYGFNGNLTLKDVLLPGKSYYYRPVIELSYYIDNLLWGMDATFMHLENILIHATNAVLVFLIATQVAGSSQIRRAEFPLLTALLFALHPLQTEAVSWIAGRTDPLAALFVLLASYNAIVYLKERRYFSLCLAMFFLLLGCLTKEVAFFFVPAAVYLALSWPRFTKTVITYPPRKRIISVVSVLTCIAGVFLFIYFRFRSGMNSIAKFFAGGGCRIPEMGEYSLRVFGFYVKKIFFPLPLNYATVTIELYYFWIGCIALTVIALLILKRSIASAFIISAAFLLVPAVLVADFNIAWTPVAERYLYLPLAFFLIGFISSCYSAMEKVGKGWIVSVTLAVLLLPAGLIVVQRNVVWQDNLALYRDSVKKSPNFGRLRNELAVALFKKGNYEEGRRQLEIGRRINDSDTADRWFLLNQLAQKIMGKTPEEARAILLHSFIDKKTADFEILIMLSRVDEQRLSLTKDTRKIQSIAEDLVDTYNYIYAKTRDPFRLYRNGQLELILNDHKKAAGYFEEAYRNAPVNAHYRLAAGKLADRLSRE